MRVTIWDDDTPTGRQDDSLGIRFDMVDEFIFNYTAPAGDIERTFVFDGIRQKNKTRYDSYLTYSYLCLLSKNIVL